MTREWEPGDVAMVTVKVNEGPRVMYRLDESHWIDTEQDYWDRGQGAWEITGIRPLVVIDPEDREAVERFREVASRWADLVPYSDMRESGDMDHTDAMQAALREYADPTPAEPPKPEPFKPGDVVRHRHSGSVWTIAEDGRMVSHRDGRVYDHGAAWFADNVTPEHYERLSLDEGEA